MSTLPPPSKLKGRGVSKDMSVGKVLSPSAKKRQEEQQRDRLLGTTLAAVVPRNIPVSGRCTDVFVKALEEEGIKYIFGIPGEENLDFLDSIRQSKKIKLVLTRHEQAAGFMAATVGRLTGRPGVCISTLGPGATNFATAAAYGFLGGFAMFIITGQKPIRHSKQGAFQIVDVVEHFGPVTKFTKQVSESSAVPYLVREAIRQSISEKPGPVHLELPEDIAELPVAEGTHLFPASKDRRPVPDKKAIDIAVNMIKAAKRPMICAAGGSNRKRVQNMVTQFVEKYGMYAVCSQMGKGVLNERHPNFIGCTALSSNDIVHVATEWADLIIMIGHDVVEKPPFFMKPNQTPVVIHVNFEGAKVDAVYFPQLSVIGDIGNALWQIKEALPVQSHWDFSFFKRCREVQEVQVYNNRHVKSARFPMNIQRVVQDVRKALEADAILCLDNGMYKIHVARAYQALVPNTVLLDNALATMGAGLPIAIAAKVLEPGKQVVAICGDGGFMMNSQELETAVRLGIHIVVIVLNDGGFHMIKWKQGTSGFPNFGLDYGNPNFVKYAESYGCKGHRVSSADNLKDVLQTCLTEPAVHLIDLPLSYASSDEELNVDLPLIVKSLRKERATWEESKVSPVEPIKENPKDESNIGPPPVTGNLATEPPVTGEIKAQWPIFVGSKPQVTKKLLPVTDKYTNEVVTNVCMGEASDVERAIVMAEAALPKMAKLPNYKRKKILMQLVQGFRDRFDEFAFALAREAGKPIKDARGEVTRLIDTFEIAAEEAVRQYGEFAPLDLSERNHGINSVVRRFPIGVVSMISPFNFPLNLAAHKIAPAIAAGCPFILKPASKTPLGALMIAECLADCEDLPEGAFSVIPCDRKVGNIFVEDERIKLLSFTGSPGVGWDMKKRCGKKKCVLELGGNAACIVDSWDEATLPLEQIVNRLLTGSFYQSGQSCIHLQRLLVRQDHYDKVVSMLVEKTKALKKGNPLSPDCFVGPLITENDAKRIEAWVNEAVTRGAKILAGGKRYRNVYDATIIENADHKCKMWVEEAFAPAILVERYTDFKQAVDMVNDSKFGIHVGLFTTDLNKSMYCWENCDVGGVVVGDIPSMRVDSQPYGGVKDSGIGREGLRYAIEDMTEIRVLLMKNVGVLA